ncbi:MAG: aminotransferase [Rhodobacteraceae bacterium]|nr:aminotransferase [Paracoccaceae bacterium]MCY4249944.1 aminotransferase [Paracoccaceae bacterium]
MVHYNTNLVNTISPPVMDARRWLQETPIETNQELLNLSQAAPVDPPPDDLLNHMAESIKMNPASNIYGPVLGNPELREEIAARWSILYQGEINPSHVAITSGCNQAFAATVATLAEPGDSVLIAAPWYFNHKMWLDMMGINTTVLTLEKDLQPNIERARKLISKDLKAISLISPNNPCGTEYSKETIWEFYQLAKENNLTLIVDETYRDFLSNDNELHEIFQDPDWNRHFVHLYSFSKAFRLTGHRVGAVIASDNFVPQIEKYLDTVSICPNQLGQLGALFGLKNLMGWLVKEKKIILQRREALKKGFKFLPEWNLLGCGAYFAYVTHPFDMRSDELVKLFLRKTNMLMLPDTMFEQLKPADEIRTYGQQIRIAYANIDQNQIEDFFLRINRFTKENLGYI